MLSILLVLTLFLVVFSLLLWLGSLFAQNYFYTEPAEGLLWRAPAAAGVIVIFYFIWSMLNLSGGNAAADKKIPYPFLLNFNNTIDMVAQPIPEFESKNKNTDPALFKLDKSSRGNRYKKENSDEYWNADGALYIKFKHGGTEYNFVPAPSEGGYRVFADENSGWIMKEQGIGVPTQSSSTQLLVYFVLNAFHWLVWVLCFWVLLQYAPGHAFLLGSVLWIASTLFILPVIFDQTQGAIG